MALLTDLVALLAEYKVDSASTLNLFARRLREAGRLSQKGRGRGAAHMTYLDAARFTIACLATDHPERAVDAESTFSSSMLTDVRFIASEARWSRLADRNCLDQILAHTLERLADGSIDREHLAGFDTERGEMPFPAIVDIDVFRSGVSAVLRDGIEVLRFSHPAAVQMMDAKHADTLRALSDAWMRETERFRSGKNLHARFDAALLRAVANLIAGKSE